MVVSFLLKIFSSVSLRRAATLFSGRMLNSLLALIFSLIAGRLLLVEDHGIFGRALALLMIVQAMTEMGLQYSMVRFLVPSIKEGESGRILAQVRASLVIKLSAFAITATIISILFLLSEFSHWFGFDPLPWLLPADHSDNFALLWLIFLGGAGMSLLSYLDAVLVSHQAYYRLALWVPTVGILRLGLLWYFFSSGPLLVEHAVYAYALSPWIAAIFYFGFFPASFFIDSLRSPAARESQWRPWVKILLSYNLWIVTASFLSILSDWLEVLMIQGAEQIAYYNAARMPMQGFLILLTTMQAILLPGFSLLTRREEFAHQFRRIYRLLVPMLLLLLPGFWVVSWFIPWWYGPAYHASVGVFLLLYPNYMLRLLFAPLGTALFALDQPFLVAVEAGLRMFSGLFWNLLLIPIWGIYGAALASLLAQFSGWIFLLFCYRNYFKYGRFFS